MTRKVKRRKRGICRCLCYTHTLFGWWLRATFFHESRIRTRCLHSLSRIHSIFTKKTLAHFFRRRKRAANTDEFDPENVRILHEMETSYKILIYVENAVKKLLTKNEKKVSPVCIRYLHAICSRRFLKHTYSKTLSFFICLRMQGGFDSCMYFPKQTK